jgi:hypothetical protein
MPTLLRDPWVLLLNSGLTLPPLRSLVISWGFLTQPTSQTNIKVGGIFPAVGKVEKAAQSAWKYGPNI